MPHWSSNDAIDFPFSVEWTDGKARLGWIEGEANVAILSHRDCEWTIDQVRASNNEVIENPAVALLIIGLIKAQCKDEIDREVMRREVETRRVG